MAEKIEIQGLTNYEIELNSQSTKKYIINLLDNHKLCEYLKESYLNSVFNPNDLHLCNYFDEDEFIACNRNRTSHLKILSMNIRSLPKHSGELKCFINVLGNEFDIIVLTEIGFRNLSTVEHLFAGYVFSYVTPDVNFYGGVGIYISKKMENVYIDEHLSITKSCHYVKCETESLFVKFTHNNVSFIVGGIYRHPKRKLFSFCKGLGQIIKKYW